MVGCYYLKLQWYLMSEEKRKLHEISQLQFLLVIQSNKLWKWRTSSIKFQHSSCKQTKIYDDSFKNILNLTHFLPLLFGLFRFHVSMFETYFIFYFFLGDSFLATLLDPCKQLAFFFFFFNCVLEDGHYFLIGMQSYTKVVTY